MDSSLFEGFICWLCAIGQSCIKSLYAWHLLRQARIALFICGGVSGQTDSLVLRVQHYPGRLFKLFVVGLPSHTAWVVDTVKPLLHPTTVANMRLCEPSDEAVPLPPDALGCVLDLPCTPDSALNGTVRLHKLLQHILCTSGYCLNLLDLACLDDHVKAGIH